MAKVTASARAGRDHGADRDERRPDDDRATAIGVATRRTCSWSGLSSASTLRERCDAAQLGQHARGEDDGTGVATGAGGAAEDEVCAFEQLGAGIRRVGRAVGRDRFAGERRRSISSDPSRSGRRPRRGRPR